MAWIESHQALGRHPKTIRLAEELGCSVPCALGYLHLFWWWALDYAPNGLVSMADALAIEAACMWHRKPNESRSNPLPSRFLSALEASLFLNESGLEGVLMVHDWDDYTGRLREQREMRKERNRRAQSARRQRLREDDVNTSQQSTGHNRTGHNRTIPDHPPTPPQGVSADAPSMTTNGTTACCALAELTHGEKHAKTCNANSVAASPSA